MNSRFVLAPWLRFWKLLYLDGFTFYGGGGSPPPAQPVQQTVQQSNIPEYAQPYVETMLGTGQQQIYNMSPSGQITGMKPYTPYSSDPTAYVAPFSPLQQQSQAGIANLQLPQAYQQGMEATGTAAGGTAGITGNIMGSQNAALQQIQDPTTMQNLMSTFMDYNLPQQQQLLAQQTGLKSAAEQSAATSSGAFGGSRQALANALTRQYGNLAQSDLIGKAYNTAYTDAINAIQQNQAQNIQRQQLGLQGMGQIGALGGQLANIGGQQLEAQKGIYGLQAQTGATQQQQQQNIINQAIQNYANAQQWPYQQLAFMSGLLRGLPLQAMTTSTYQAPPSLTSQVGGMGIAGLGLANAMSDERTKQNIAFVKKTSAGYNIYDFEYKPEFKDAHGHGFFRGVMASEIEKIIPEAVVTLANGFKSVNYGMLGISMERCV